MIKNYAILPCNGLDKCAGVISRELALKLCENPANEMICPVYYRVAESKYTRLATERPLLIIDGCQTHCASKLAMEKDLKISVKVTVTEEARTQKMELGNNLRLLDSDRALVEIILARLDHRNGNGIVPSDETSALINFAYETYQHGKFIFRVPSNPEVYFNENDCWAAVSGNRARVGVTDFVQQNLSDILFFRPPEMGQNIAQFGEVGEIESSKAVFELVSPVSGKVVAINQNLMNRPELINENPYELGWIAELELTDFLSDKELLTGFGPYFKKLIKKIEGLNE